jgi:hypothetical protein
MSALVHGIFVLAGVSSYALPAYEGIARGSPFYTLLFLTLGCLSFVLHCEDSGICAPLKASVAQRLSEISSACSIFVFGVMALVVFEVRGEFAGRVVAGAWALVCWLQLPGAPPSLTLGVALALAVGVLVADHFRFKRGRFTDMYYKRLAVIACMAGLGAALFAGLRQLWLWDGLWHAYTAVATYLVLLAQRVKRQQALQAGRSRDGGHLGGGGGGGGAHAASAAKRRGGSGGALAGGSSGEEGSANPPV